MATNRKYTFAEDVAIFNKWRDEKSLTQIAIELDRSKKGLQHRKQRLGLNRWVTKNWNFVWEPSDFDLGYISGFFDGDGSVDAYSQVGRLTPDVGVTFSNSDRAILERIESIVGVTGTWCWNETHPKATKPCGSLRYHGEVAKELLKKLVLVGSKHFQRVAAIELMESLRADRYYKNRTPSPIYESYKEMMEELIVYIKNCKWLVN